MKWLKNFIKRILFGNKVKLLNSSKEDYIRNTKIENNDTDKIQEKDFSFELKKMAYPWMNDGNGFGIIKDFKYEDLV